MRNMFSNLHALLPHLLPKADKSTIVDEAVTHIKSLQQTLQKLQRQKLERLHGLTPMNFDGQSSIITPQKLPMDSSEAFMADQVSLNNTNSNSSNALPVSLSRFPALFQTWTSLNVILNVCDDHAQNSVCSMKKAGLSLLSAMCWRSTSWMLCLLMFYRIRIGPCTGIKPIIHREGYELRNGEQFEEMTLNLCVLTPNQIVWDSEVKEIILSTNSGQIGVLPNHAPIATAVDIGILRIRLNDQWLMMALMGGFARIGNNEIIVLVNDAEKSSDIDPQEAQQTLEIVEANLKKAEGKRQIIEANVALRRARTRVEAINVIKFLIFRFIQQQ
ncbi:unnamed protein product [Camellia sinensis]